MYPGLSGPGSGLNDRGVPPAGRPDAVEAIDALHRVVIAESPLSPKQQQMVQFAQLLVLGERHLAGVHARRARSAGATPAELIGVAETALLTAGLPAYNLGVSTVNELLQDD